VPDGTPEPPDYLPSAWPGCRAPHVWLSDGSSVLDHFGRGFVLVVSGAADASPLVKATRRRGVPLTVLPRADPAAARLHERPLVLVRPDGHVGWRGEHAPAGPVAVIDRLRGADTGNRAADTVRVPAAVSARVATHQR
jgi:hypothetical protein